ncbi:MAG TPA: DUF2167 domain-containing protein [Candidatus Eisenbacteria bacterium]|nr:DUF2167 domain-containing protein [Candidatus Eisenbacteria bacterium]
MFHSFRLPLIALVLAIFALPSTGSAQVDSAGVNLMRSIEWQEGPATGRLGDLAEVQVPAGMVFTGREGTKKWMEATHNLTSDDDLGIVTPTSENEKWWVIFTNNDVGHVMDDDKDKLDADALMKTLQSNTRESNKERQKRGWSTFEITGWERPPFYDSRTNNLTWAVRLRGSRGESVNYSVRILGREGYMSADLVLRPEELAASIPAFEKLLAGYTYTQGNRYAEYRKGDKLAAYGLTALVAGGAGAVAMKTGLLAKFWKLIVVGVLGLVAAVKRFIKTILGWGKNEETIKSS